MNKIITSIFILIFLPGCEQIIDNPKWPDYKEKLVVTAWLVQNNPDSLEISCALRRTLPLSEIFDTNKIKVSNAIVTLSSGDFNQTLQPQNDPSFYYSKFINPKKSDYHLTVKWNGLSAFSDLTIRKKDSTIDTISLRFLGFGFEGPDFEIAVNFFPIPEGFKHEFYWYVYDSKQYYLSDVLYDYTSSIGTVPPKSICTPCFTDLGNGEVKGRFVGKAPDTSHVRGYIELIVHSPSYEDYQNARWWYGGSGGLFEDSPNGLNPKFNVMGDGIGFFWCEYHERKEVIY